MLKNLILAAILLAAATVPAPARAAGEPAPPTPVVMETTEDAKLFYAPDKQIGILKTGAQVTVLKEQGAWALVKYADEKIVVQGWIEKRLLGPIAPENVDPLRGLKEDQN